MNITFLGQGYEPDSINAVGNYLIKFLSDEQFHTFGGMSAFASEAGIRGLSEYFKNPKVEYNLIIGVDQEGTSKEALYEILKLGINSYIFYQNEPLIFHPKIYLFEGDNKIKIVLGSSNLTGKGLFSNVEGSFLIEFNLKDIQGLNLLKELKDYYSGFFNLSDLNLFPITTEIIEQFVSLGIVPNEKYRNLNRKKTYLPQDAKSDLKNKLVIPKRQMAKLPSAFKGKSKKFKTVLKIVEELELPKSEIPDTKVLLWTKNKLSNSDAQSVLMRTNPTGKLGLAQGRFKKDGVLINQQKYFRETVFNELIWEKTDKERKTYEETYANFRVIILGKDFGIYSLKLSHDPSRIAGQDNTPTWLHWGPELNLILRDWPVAGKVLNLYYLQSDSVFLIEIV